MLPQAISPKKMSQPDYQLKIQNFNFQRSQQIQGDDEKPALQYNGIFGFKIRKFRLI